MHLSQCPEGAVQFCRIYHFKGDCIQWCLNVFKEVTSHVAWSVIQVFGTDLVHVCGCRCWALIQKHYTCDCRCWARTSYSTHTATLAPRRQPCPRTHLPWPDVVHLQTAVHRHHVPIRFSSKPVGAVVIFCALSDATSVASVLMSWRGRAVWVDYQSRMSAVILSLHEKERPLLKHRRARCMSRTIMVQVFPSLADESDESKPKPWRGRSSDWRLCQDLSYWHATVSSYHSQLLTL
jgi:hypothetical protein